MRKTIFCMLCFCCSVYYGQTQYIAYFTPPSDFSNYGFSMYGPTSDVVDNSGLPRSCSFYNGLFSTPAVGMYSQNNMIDAQAQSLAYSYDSLVFMFKVKTSGFAKNFRIRGEFLQNINNFPYSLTQNYNGIDSINVRFKVGFTTTLPFNWKIWLEKQDTTLNNFTISLSNLDIKGYLHYNNAGIEELTNSKYQITYNDDMLFLNEKWMGKKYWITDLFGRVVCSDIANSLKEPINLGNGMYIINTEQFSQKIIISHQ